MEIEYQNTKTDHQKFYKEYLATCLQKRIGLLIIAPLLVGYIVSSGESFKWSIFILGCIITFVILFSILYLIPYLRSIWYLNRFIAQNSTYSEKRKLSTTQTGLIIQSFSKTRELNWASIIGIDSTENYIYFQLADKTNIIIPKHYFASEVDAINFLGLVREEIIKIGGNKISGALHNNPSTRPNYWLGVLCLIPLIGAFVGLAFIVLGISKFKDKWFTAIGAFGILFTVVFYSSLSFYGKHGEIPKSMHKKTSQTILDGLVKTIELYKLEYGQYPNELKQLQMDGVALIIYDPIQSGQRRQDTHFNYKNLGDKYLLFSSGQDGIPNTEDDLFPEIVLNERSKITIGWVKSE